MTLGLLTSIRRPLTLEQPIIMWDVHRHTPIPRKPPRKGSFVGPPLTCRPPHQLCGDSWRTALPYYCPTTATLKAMPRGSMTTAMCGTPPCHHIASSSLCHHAMQKRTYHSHYHATTTVHETSSAHCWPPPQNHKASSGKHHTTTKSLPLTH